ncbi:MAG: hypothetical protein IMZ50_02160 [Candidatus Atribacteria bacterium]|nr:hypothetical protein [Candidatus Atribacteria bacterium]
MRKMLVVLMCFALVAVVCSCGVMMNAQYTQILDKTVVLSADMAKRADAGTITPEEMEDALILQAKTWKLFQDARDGTAPATETP